MPRPLSLCHWGPFEAELTRGRLVAARPWRDSGADAAMIGALPELVYSEQRIDRPYLRPSWRRGRGDGARRGREPLVPVSWDEALTLVADELERVRDRYGHPALFAGSYGWSSAGRFHHARSQIRRFFGAFGGFTDQTGNYSWGAAAVLLPHVLGDAAAVSGAATSWSSIAEHSDLFVAFGGLHPKNWRVTSGGAGRYAMPRQIAAARRRGVKFIVISPMADDVPPGSDAEWIAARPGSDTAILLALCQEMVRSGRADRAFLARYCAGVEPFLRYLDGRADGQEKTLQWAAELADVPPRRLRSLARQIGDGRVMLSAAWSLQRARHGEQPYWALIALAALLGQIGLPGGGFSFGYGSMNAIGDDARHGLVPSLPGLGNERGGAIPVARFVDMLENPGARIDYNGAELHYPDVRLIYWAGGNPFHHAQDLFRLERVWARPQTVIVHETFWTATARRADIVLPATTSLERADIGGSSRDPHVFYMPKLIDAVGGARDDYAIFSELAERSGCHSAFTEDRSAGQWLRRLWRHTERAARAQGIDAPSFDRLVDDGVWRVPPPPTPEVYLSAFRRDPKARPLATPSGRIELYSATIAGFGYDDMPGHPSWLPARESLSAAPPADALALLSRQPARALHSQLMQTKLGPAAAPPILLNPDDARVRRLDDGDTVEVSSPRGVCLATATLSADCRRGVAAMETGPWFDADQSVGLDRGGNPNALTADVPSSRLTQACAAQTCLVWVRKARRGVPEGRGRLG